MISLIRATIAKLPPRVKFVGALFAIDMSIGTVGVIWAISMGAI